MNESIYSREKLQNFIPQDSGSLSRVALGVNGVIVVYIPAVDCEGNSYIRPVISTLVHDNELSEILNQEARYLMKQVRNIAVPL